MIVLDDIACWRGRKKVIGASSSKDYLGSGAKHNSRVFHRWENGSLIAVIILAVKQTHERPHRGVSILFIYRVPNIQVPVRKSCG